MVQLLANSKLATYFMWDEMEKNAKLCRFLFFKLSFTVLLVHEICCISIKNNFSKAKKQLHGAYSVHPIEKGRVDCGYLHISILYTGGGGWEEGFVSYLHIVHIGLAACPCVYIQEAKYVEGWPNTTSAWAGWSRFDIPVDRYDRVHSLLHCTSWTLRLYSPIVCELREMFTDVQLPVRQGWGWGAGGGAHPSCCPQPPYPAVHFTVHSYSH